MATSPPGGGGCEGGLGGLDPCVTHLIILKAIDLEVDSSVLEKAQQQAPPSLHSISHLHSMTHVPVGHSHKPFARRLDQRPGPRQDLQILTLLQPHPLQISLK